MKSIRLFLCALGLTSLNSFATIMLDPTQVVVPQFDGGLIIGVTGVYVEPTFTNGYEDYASFNIGTSTSFASSIQNNNLGYDWGWGANLGYIFPQTGNDINLQYFRFHTDDSSSGLGSLTLPYLTLASGGFNYLLSNANNRIDFDLDQVDLTAGQYVFIGCRTLIHLAAGVRALELDTKNINNYGGFVEDIIAEELFPTTLYSNQKSDYEGIGPVADIKAHYDLSYGFGLVGELTSALLVGNINDKWNVYATTVSGGETFPSSLEVDSSSKRRIVPNLDAKLGADYSYIFANEGSSKINFEIGYFISHYFNAVDRLTGTTGIPFDTLTTAIAITAHKTSDAALNGPYASLSVQF